MAKIRTGWCTVQQSGEDTAKQRSDGLEIVSGHDEASGGFFESLESLVGVEPGWVVSGEPTLGDTWFVVVHDVGVVADEEEGAVVFEVDLHADEAVGVTGEMVEGETLGEVDGTIVERFPVQLV